MSLREAHVVWNGQPETCLIVAPPIEQSTNQRGWSEAEYCMDEATGKLQMKCAWCLCVLRLSGRGHFHRQTLPEKIRRPRFR
jgi:hypothetical protein